MKFQLGKVRHGVVVGVIVMSLGVAIGPTSVAQEKLSTNRRGRR